jgi:hypothetical protein
MAGQRKRKKRNQGSVIKINISWQIFTVNGVEKDLDYSGFDSRNMLEKS